MPNWSQRWWRSDEVQWGLTACHGWCNLENAELLMDGQPLCLDCCELLLERLEAIEINRDAAAMLPAVGG